MISVLAHVTPNELPAGVAMFLAGLGTGVALTVAAYRWLVGSRK